jgi:signal peptidase I
MDYGTEETGFWDRFKSGFAELIEFVAIVGVIVLIIQFFIAKPHQVSGNSMFPNFHNGDYIITNLLTTRFGELKHGEVVVFKYPRDRSKVFIKRVVGMGGDRVKIMRDHIYLNGKLLEEPYLPPATPTRTKGFMDEGEEVTVPNGQYFVVGDNREGSSDSREWGPLTKEDIIGQAYLRYWPLNKVGLIKIDQSSQ